MLKTDSVVRCIRTVYRCLLCSTSTAREWVLHLAPGGFFCTTQQHLYQATAVNPDVVPEVAQPRQAIPTQEINPKFLTWTTAKALILEYPTLEEYKKANERLIRDLENHDDEDY